MQAELRPQSAVIGTGKRLTTTNSRMIDRALRRARIDLLPRTERERVHNLCVAAVGTEQNVGRVHTICENLAKREVAAWLQEHRKAEAAIQRKVQNADKFFEDLRARFADPSGKLIPHGLTPQDKCEHSVYIPEFYCGICRDGRENGLEFRADVYGPVLRRALAQAKRHLCQFCKTGEGRKDFEDLQQDAIIEVCRAWKRRGGDMTRGLAFKIARDVANGFLKERIDETDIRLTDPDGNPILNEFGKARGLDGAELKRTSEDTSLPKTAQKAAEDLLHDYQVMVPRFERFIAEDSEKVDDSEPNYHNPSTDAKMVRGQDFRANENRLAEGIDTWREIQRLVESWHGTQRAVAEAVLTGNFTVQKFADASGMAPATVGRVYAVVTRAFRSFIKKLEKT